MVKFLLDQGVENHVMEPSCSITDSVYLLAQQVSRTMDLAGVLDKQTQLFAHLENIRKDLNV